MPKKNNTIGIATDDIMESVKKIRKIITSRGYEHGQRLPPERALAEELGITRNALREALSVLEYEGVIWRHVGRGTFVGPNTQSTDIDIRPLIENVSPAEIMDLRLILEPKIAAMASLRASTQDVERIQAAARGFKNATGFEETEKWDLLFHETIAQATKSHLIKSVFNMVNQLREGGVWGQMKKSSLTPDWCKKYASQHIKIVDAIRDHNPSLVEELMFDHLQTVLRAMQCNS